MVKNKERRVEDHLRITDGLRRTVEWGETLQDMEKCLEDLWGWQSPNLRTGQVTVAVQWKREVQLASM